MSRYLVSARKYRPQTFGELVGQEHVAETLRNALRLDRLAHAYLFSGPRGVGKTTAARLLAKAINCEAPLDDRPLAEPCRACTSCRDFEDGRSLNIIEIDAASNNKVDDIRELRETVRVPPQGARRKVYIIDEVHMLSTSAFNALLKTLEEPPPYVLFIFATTEPHKVLPTILSRCQRFDFRRIAPPDAVEHLRQICAAEGFTADDASLLLIARKGDGALRDTLSAFDQAVALVGQDLNYPALSEALGVVGVDLYFEVTEAVRARDGAALLLLVDRLMRRGYDLAEFLVGLQEHLRNLLVARTLPDAALIETDEPTRVRYRAAAQGLTEPDLLRHLGLVAEAEEALKTAAQPRLRLELTLLKMVALASVRDLNAALNAVGRLERMARDGTIPALPLAAEPDAVFPAAPGAPTAHASQAAPPAAPPASASAPERPDEPPHATAPPARAAVPAPPASAPMPARADVPAARAPEPSPRPAEPPARASRQAPDDDGGDPAPSPTPPPRAIPPSATTPPPQPGEPEISLGSLFSGPALKRRADRSAPESRAAYAAPEAAAPAAVAEAAPDRLATLQQAWRRVVRALPSARSVAALADSHPLALDATGTATVQLTSLLGSRVLDDCAEALREHVHAACGLTVRAFRAHVVAPEASGDGTGAAEEADPRAQILALRQDLPLAAALLDAIGGEIA